MPVALIAAGIGAAGAIGASVIGGSAAKSAANTEANAASQDNALQSQIYNSNKALEQPYITSGNNAETALNGFLGLGGDPAASSKAFNDYLNSTGYQFNRDQGLDAVNQSKAAAGLLKSGSTLKALDTYGTGLADQYGQQYVGNLQNEVGTGVTATGALAGQGQTYANAVSNNNNTSAATTADAGIAGATIGTNAITNAIRAAGSFSGGNAFGGSSFGGGSGNIDTSALNAFAVPSISGIPAATIGG